MESSFTLSAEEKYKSSIGPSRWTSQQETEKPDLSKIPLWQGKIKDGSAIQYLKDHYGDYLKTLGAQENLIYRQDIRAHDKKLVKHVSQEAYERGEQGRSYIPTRSDEFDEIQVERAIDENTIKGTVK